jgi:hypothetical protein
VLAPTHTHTSVLLKRRRDLGGFGEKRAQQQYFGAIEMARFFLVWVGRWRGVDWLGACVTGYLSTFLSSSIYLFISPSISPTNIPPPPKLQTNPSFLPSFLPSSRTSFHTYPPHHSYQPQKKVTIQYNTIQYSKQASKQAKKLQSPARPHQINNQNKLNTVATKYVSASVSVSVSVATKYVSVSVHPPQKKTN